MLRLALVVATSLTLGCGSDFKLPEPERQSRTLTLAGTTYHTFDVTLDVPLGWSTDAAEIEARGPITIRNFQRKRFYHALRLSTFYLCEQGAAACDTAEFDRGEVRPLADVADLEPTEHVRPGLRKRAMELGDAEGNRIGHVVVEHLVAGPAPYVVACEVIGAHPRNVAACEAMVIGPLHDLVDDGARAKELAQIAECPAGNRIELEELTGAMRKVSARSGVRVSARPAGRSPRLLTVKLESAPGDGLPTSLELTFIGTPGKEVMSGTYQRATPGTSGVTLAMNLAGSPLDLAVDATSKVAALIVARTATRVCGKVLMQSGAMRLGASFDAPIENAPR